LPAGADRRNTFLDEPGELRLYCDSLNRPLPRRQERDTNQPAPKAKEATPKKNETQRAG